MKIRSSSSSSGFSRFRCGRSLARDCSPRVELLGRGVVPRWRGRVVRGYDQGLPQCHACELHGARRVRKRAIIWWLRSRAASAAAVAPVVTPVVAPPRLPVGFKPTSLQVTIILCLMKRWQQQTNLKNIAALVQDVTPELLPMMAEAHISSELEVLEAANVVSIDRLGTHHAYYHLTTLGRNWAIEAMKDAKAKLDAE